MPVHVRGKVWDSFIKNRPKLPICLNFTVHLTAFCEFLQIIIFVIVAAVGTNEGGKVVHRGGIKVLIDYFQNGENSK